MWENKKLLLMARGSIILNLFMATYKIWLAIATHSMLLFIYAFYNLGIVMTKTTFVHNVKKDSDKYYLVGITVVISSISFIVYSIRLMINGKINNYDTHISILMTIAVLIEIGISLYGIITARKQKNIKVETIKLTSFASNLISLSLTQTVILSFITNKDFSKYNGITGIFFGSLATIVGVYMIFYIKKNNEKDCKI